jgi:DNA invertase Pin-like site-specific DNA recombinase
MEPVKPMIRRCAVYTRKSSEEGLEQSFNSLHAQREACEAFIKSQASEGWRLVRTHYDDGGLSGASMERPALQRLLEHIRQGLVEVVVVYKVDRLTRSLADFARIVELFDTQQVSFVAVTQQFNTTSSMGRLTLNVLLSFAQFEREVTGERIRDKIAASKRKGLWMGGVVPLGYALRERGLVINPAEAKVVRRIFRRYLELGSVRLLKEELDRQGVVSRPRSLGNGAPPKRHSFSRGAIYVLLSNPLYIGEVRHRGARHPGQHQAIVDQELWDKVQHQLHEHTARRRRSAVKVEPSPLAGKLFDSSGVGLTPSHARKGARRYRYYVTRGLNMRPAERMRDAWRLPAPEIERTVVAAVRRLLGDEPTIATAVEEAGMTASQIPSVLEATRAWDHKLQSEGEVGAALTALVHRVELGHDGLRLSVKVPVPPDQDRVAGQTDTIITRFVRMHLRRRGAELRLVIQDAHAARPAVDITLLKALGRARRWFDQLVSGEATSLTAIAQREGIGVRYVGRLMPLAFLAPSIIESITQGRQPAELTTETLTRRTVVPPEWEAQQKALDLSGERL